jgi:hypothetical protein
MRIEKHPVANACKWAAQMALNKREDTGGDLH